MGVTGDIEEGVRKNGDIQAMDRVRKQKQRRRLNSPECRKEELGRHVALTGGMQMDITCRKRQNWKAVGLMSFQVRNRWKANANTYLQTADRSGSQLPLFEAFHVGTDVPLTLNVHPDDSSHHSSSRMPFIDLDQVCLTPTHASELLAVLPFDFIISTEKGQYRLHRVVMEAISPIIKETNTEHYHLTLDDPVNLFRKLVTVFRGERVTVLEEECKFMRSVVGAL
jgi:hypothetical protein